LNGYFLMKNFAVVKGKTHYQKHIKSIKIKFKTVTKANHGN